MFKDTNEYPIQKYTGSGMKRTQVQKLPSPWSHGIPPFHKVCSLSNPCNLNPVLSGFYIGFHQVGVTLNHWPPVNSLTISPFSPLQGVCWGVGEGKSPQASNHRLTSLATSSPNPRLFRNPPAISHHIFTQKDL